MNGGQDWYCVCKKVLPAGDALSLISPKGPMNEMVVRGVAIIRLQGPNKTLNGTASNMRFTNIGYDDETLRTAIGDGFGDKTTAIQASTRHGQIRKCQSFAEEPIT